MLISHKVYHVHVYTNCLLQIVKRDCFTLFMHFLHLNVSSLCVKKGEPGYDHLYKLRPFIEPLIAHFQQHYIFSKEVCIDESMIGFKGRLSFIQYMPKKQLMGMKALFWLTHRQDTCTTGTCTQVHTNAPSKCKSSPLFLSTLAPFTLFPLQHITVLHALCFNREG